MYGNFAHVQKNHLMAKLAEIKISTIIYFTDMQYKRSILI